MSQQINLYNPLFEKKRKPFSTATMGQALAVVVVGMVAVCAYATLQTRGVERAAVQLAQQVKMQRDQVAQIAKMPVRMPSRTLEAEAAKLEAEVNARQSSLQALGTGQLGNTAGFSEFFAALGRQAVPGVWLTSVTIGESGSELLVQGRALRADLMPAFLRALNKEPVMRGRRVTEMKLTAKGGEKSDKGAPEPQAFIEFTFSAPVQVAEAGQP